MNTCIIILAAGNSSRLGSPKQLLSYQGKTLLHKVSSEALITSCKPIIVVLGAYAKEIILQHNRPEITYIVNDDWQSGMASSIIKGLTTTLAINNEIENIIIAVSDQPFISAEIFENLIKAHISTNKGIVASEYAKTIGTPTLFNKKYFKQLLSLSGTAGAKKILEANVADSTTITFEMGYIDIDTENDYNNLINNK